MNEIGSRDGIAIDVGFGNIKLCRDENGSFAEAIVEITRHGQPSDTLEMTLRVPATHKEPLADIVERSRIQILQMLRAATDRMERETAETLIYNW